MLAISYSDHARTALEERELAQQTAGNLYRWRALNLFDRDSSQNTPGSFRSHPIWIA
jgi:hypothetical protein